MSTKQKAFLGVKFFVAVLLTGVVALLTVNLVNPGLLVFSTSGESDQVVPEVTGKFEAPAAADRKDAPSLNTPASGADQVLSNPGQAAN